MPESEALQEFAPSTCKQTGEPVTDCAHCRQLRGELPSEEELQKIFAKQHAERVEEHKRAAATEGDLAVTKNRDLGAVLDMARRRANTTGAVVPIWCPRCRGEHAEGNRESCDLNLAQIVDQEVEREIPRRFRSAEVDNDRVAEWLGGVLSGTADKEGLLLSGPTGTGKTHQLYGVVKALIREGKHPRVENVNTLLDRLRPDGGGALEEFTSAEWLCLDDLTGHKASEWTEQVLYELVNARYESMSPTVLTTNAAAKELGDLLGDRIASRLAEMCAVVPMTGRDRRRAR